MKGIAYVINLSEFDNQKFINVYLETEHVNIPVIMYEYQNDKSLFDFCGKFFTNRVLKMTKTDYNTFYNIHTTTGYTFNPQEILIDNFDFVFPDGLTAREMLLLQYIHGKRIKGKIAQYFWDDYLLDCDYTLKMLVKEGFLTTKDYLFNLEFATKPELQKAVKNDLPKKAQKNIYVDYIKQKLSEEELKTYFSGICYKLTPLGEETLKKCPDIHEFHNSYYRYAFDLSIDEYYYLRLINPNKHSSDLIHLLINDAKNGQPSIFTWRELNMELQEDLIEQVEPEIVRIEIPPIKEDKPSNIETLTFESILNKYQDTGGKMIKRISDEEFLNIVFRKPKNQEAAGNNKAPKVEETVNNPIEIPIPKVEEIESVTIEKIEPSLDEIIPNNQAESEPEEVIIENKTESLFEPVKKEEIKFIPVNPEKLVKIEDIPLYEPFLLNFVISSIICIIIIVCYYLLVS